MRIVYLFILLCTLVLPAFANKAPIRIENEMITLVFDGNTGALISLINKKTGDNYLKRPGEGNLFRLFLNPLKMPRLSAGPANDALGGTIINPADCLLRATQLRKTTHATQLDLQLLHKASGTAIDLTVTLGNNDPYFDCGLSVTGGTNSNAYASFPYLSGLTLGSDSSSNLAVNMWDRGYPGIAAWKKNSGGVYGKDVSMQWQCVYDQEMNEGIAFIAMDTTFSNKILTCFPGGGMQSLYFDKKVIAGQSAKWPSTRIAVFNGSWRTAAGLYKSWYDANLNPRPVPDWYKKVAIRGSSWIPNKAAVESYKKSGNPQTFTSFNQLPMLYGGGYADVLEMAMWNEDVNLWPDTYGPWMSSGFLGFRNDLGGKEAFEAGVKKVHRYGRKVCMYVAGYGIRNSSPLFTGDSWKDWAIVDNEKGEINFGYRGEKDDEVYGIFNCVGYKPWQDNIIRVCTMLAKAGVDEIRLDEIGFPFKPCFNAAHHHDTPYGSHQWTREYLRRIREAMDQINPDLVISTEFFMDYFHTYTNGALVMDCSGSELDAMKVTMPDYLALSYHAGAAEAMVTGAVMGKPTAYRLDWAWSHVGTDRPKDYPSGPGISLPWYQLYPAFAEAFIHADPTNKDPFAPKDARWAGHLWKSDRYWILTGGHDDLTPLPTKSVDVVLPELPEKFRYAYAFNAVTLEMKPVKINRIKGKITITLNDPLSLVFFPASDCPALSFISAADTVTSGQELKAIVRLMAPWSPVMLKKAEKTIQLNAPGFSVSAVEKGSFVISVPAGTSKNNYYLEVKGNCLPVRKWFAIE